MRLPILYVPILLYSRPEITHPVTSSPIRLSSRISHFHVMIEINISTLLISYHADSLSFVCVVYTAGQPPSPTSGGD
jgi:hypothetical protein